MREAGAQQPSSARRLSYAALLTAVGLTGAYAETIPNFEVLTLVAFCAGALLGVRDGLLTGAVMEAVFSVLNPYGPVAPLITVAQVLGMASSGAVGGALMAAGLARMPAGPRCALLIAAAFIVTLFFDLVTNVASGIVFGQMRATLVLGIPFSLWHIGWNVVLFAAIGTPLVVALSHYRSRLSS